MSTEHPIIFTGWSVPRILNRQKTHTRRVAKRFANKVGEWADGIGRCSDGTFIAWWGQEPVGGWEAATEARYPHGGGIRCPYGAPGDLLWVRETHYRFGHWNKNGISKTGRQKWRFKATTTEIHFAGDPPDDVKPYAYRAEGWYKRPSIFMPKKYARTWLRVKRVWPERVQDISIDDMLAEGVIWTRHWDEVTVEEIGSYPQEREDEAWQDYIRAAFRRLWDSINAKRGYGWDMNPWNWAIEFEWLKGGKP